MKNIKPYKGVVKDPSKMKMQSLRNYVAWCESYLDWCLDGDGRVSAYDRMTNSMSPYVIELEKRNGTVKK